MRTSDYHEQVEDGQRWSLSDRMLATFDFETDPFKFGTIVRPFALGIFDGLDYRACWAKTPRDLIAWFIARIKEMPPSYLYAHNGGNFDFMFIREHWRGDPRVIDGRIVEVEVEGHLLRDSYKLFPVKLADLGGKKEIEIWKLEREHREKYREEILDYMRADCISLHEHLGTFIDEFGLHLTAPAAAIKELAKFHEFSRVSMEVDKEIRPFFFGGRCQAFDLGVFKGDWKIYDVNSMYPFVMKTVQHPIGKLAYVSGEIHKGSTAFLELEAINHGCAPFRKENGSLDFNVPRGRFMLSIHEYNAGIETGTLEPLDIIRTLNFDRWGNFSTFVDHYNAKKIEAEKNKDKARREFYKRSILNSAYGKFATDPTKFRTYTITRENLPICSEEPKCSREEHCGLCWEPESHIGDGYTLWSQPVECFSWQYFNIATGASITGAARAVLLRALARAKRPKYCDTDSIICESLNMELDATKLGAWKLEASGDTLSIAGKKLYALTRGRQAESVKIASKGVKLSAKQIRKIASGGHIEYKSDVPRFKMDGRIIYNPRTIRRSRRSRTNFKPLRKMVDN